MEIYSSFRKYFESLPTATLLGLSFVAHMLLFQVIIMMIGNAGLFTPNIVLLTFAASLAPVLITIVSRLRLNIGRLTERSFMLRVLIGVAVFCGLVWYSVSGNSLTWDVRAYHQPKIFYALAHGDISLSAFSTPRETSLFSSFDYYLAPYLLIFKNSYWVSLPVAISVFFIYGAILDIFESLGLKKFGAGLTILALTLNPFLLHEITLLKNHLTSALIFALIFAVWTNARKNVNEDNHFFQFNLLALQILGLTIFSIKSLVVIPTFVITIILIADLWLLKNRNNAAPNIFSTIKWQLPFSLIGCLLVVLPIFLFGEPSEKLISDWVNIPPNPFCGVEMTKYWFQLNLSDLQIFDIRHDPNSVNKNCAGNPGLVRDTFNQLLYIQGYYSLWFWLSVLVAPLVFLKGTRQHKLCFILPLAALFIFESLYKNSSVNGRLWIIFMVPSISICCHFLASELRSYARYIVLFGFSFLLIKNAIIITQPRYVSHSEGAYKRVSKDFNVDLNPDKKIYLAISRQQNSSELLDNLYLIMEELEWDWTKIEFGQFKHWEAHHPLGWGIGDDSRFTHHLQCGSHNPNRDWNLLKRLKSKTLDANIELARIKRKKDCKLTVLSPIRP